MRVPIPAASSWRSRGLTWTRSLISPRAWLLLAAALVLALVPQTPAPAQAQAATAGALDVSFGGDGIVTTGVIPGKGTVNAVAALSDGKVLVAGGSVLGANEAFALARYTANGDLDTTFGDGDGRVSTRIGIGGSDVAYTMAVLSDGKILLAGQALIRVSGVSTTDFALARYTADGALDATFGTEGVVTTPIGSSNDAAHAMAVQDDGKIVVAGYANQGSVDDFALARYNADGSLDTDFGGDADGNNVKDGYVTTPIGSGVNSINEVAVLADGKILAAGISDNDFALVRYTANGSLDTGFGTGGKVTTDIGGADKIEGMAVLSDGKIVAGGHSGGDFALARYTSTGVLDTGFGTGGKVTTAIGSGSDYGYAMTVQSDDGKIVVAGESHNGSNNDFALARYTAAGVLDTGFGTGGKVTTAIGTGNDGANALALQSDGRIVLAGFSHNGRHNDFAVARYTAAGALDTSFGRDADNDNTRDGYVTTAMGSQHSYGYAVALQPDGKLVVAGNGFNGTTKKEDFVLARFNADGTMDIGFGRDGVVITDFNSGASDYGEAVAVQSDGKIVVAGRSNKGNVKDFAVARYNSDGSLDTGFGTGGKVTTDFSSGEDRPYAIAVQSDNKIVVAGYANNGSDNDFAMARYNADGSLDTGFGTGGKVTTALGSGNDLIRAMTLLDDGKILVAGSAHIGSDLDSALARYNSDGSLDSGFGGDADGNNVKDGYVTTAIGSSNDSGLSVAIQEDGKIVVAGAAHNGSDWDFMLARYNADGGGLDTTFGGDADDNNVKDGYVITPVGSNLDIPYGLLLQSGGRIVLAGFSHDGGPNFNTHFPPYDFALTRYTEDGELDTDFGDGGKVTTPIGPGDDRAYGAVLQPDGKIVLAGFSHSGSVYQFALARYHAPTGNTVSLSASPIRVDEGEPVTVTARLSSALEEDVTIPLVITDDTAEPGDHGTLASITISSGATFGTGTITTRQDADIRDETFKVSLGTLPPELVAGSPSSVTITIVDGDVPLPTLPRLPIDFSQQRPANERQPTGEGAGDPFCYIGAGTSDENNNGTEYIRYPDGRIEETTRQSDAIRSMYACD